MTIIFLSLSKSFLGADFASQRGIYTDLLREFDKNRHTVYVVAPTERNLGLHTRFIKVANMYLLQVRTGNIRNTNPIEKGISTVLLERQFIRAIEKYINDVRFDLVLFSTPPITFERVVNFIKKRDRAKSYLLLKDIFPQNAVDLGYFGKQNLLYWYFRRKEKKLYRISDYIGCMSPANVRYLLMHNPDIKSHKVEVNPNTIEPDILKSDADEIRKIREEYGIPVDSIVFIYGGNLGKPQGLTSLLQVLESNLNREEVFFIITGSGTERFMIEDWFISKRPRNSILLQFLPRPEFDRLVRSSDVGLIFLDPRFTIPNFPSRLLNYFEYRLPVLAATDCNTDIGSIIEENQMGLWCKNGDIGSINKAINEFISDKSKISMMGANGHAYLLKNWTVDISAQLIMNHFN